MSWVAICERVRSGCGRDQNKSYVNVVQSVRTLKVDATTFVAQNPTHPWADPGFKEFIVDVDDTTGETYHADPGLLINDHHSLPKYQNETDGSAQPYNPGSFADPEDDQSVFSAGVPLADDRWIVRLYDDDPGTTGNHLATLDVDEGSDAGEKTIYLKLFDENDSPSATNTQNQQTEIAGKLMIFDFTSGLTTFGLNTNSTGTARFGSSSRYRVIGPAAEKNVTFRVFGRTLTAR